MCTVVPKLAETFVRPWLRRQLVLVLSERLAFLPKMPWVSLTAKYSKRMQLLSNINGFSQDGRRSG